MRGEWHIASLAENHMRCMSISPVLLYLSMLYLSDIKSGKSEVLATAGQSKVGAMPRYTYICICRGTTRWNNIMLGYYLLLSIGIYSMCVFKFCCVCLVFVCFQLIMEVAKKISFCCNILWSLYVERTKCAISGVCVCMYMWVCGLQFNIFL